MEKTIVVTGGAGFIGSALVRHLLRETPHRVVNLDKLSYTGDPAVLSSDRYRFEPCNICGATIDAGKIQRALGWTSEESFDTGLRKTVAWFLENGDWCERTLSGEYQMDRLGRARSVA